MLRGILVRPKQERTNGALLWLLRNVLGGGEDSWRKVRMRVVCILEPQENEEAFRKYRVGSAVKIHEVNPLFARWPSQKEKFFQSKICTGNGDL